MPLYEYYCADCNGVFELLRPVRQAANDQPCPECDADAKRIMSREFAAFTYRDGYARRIPDDGSYIHLGEKVSTTISRSVDSYSHPELEPPDTSRPSVEDIEKYEASQVAKQQAEFKPNERIMTQDTRTVAKIREKMVKTRGTPAEERAKQNAIRTEKEFIKKQQKANT